MEPLDVGFRSKLRRIVLVTVGVVGFAFVLYVLWRVLYGFIDPGDVSTEKKDLVQAFAVIAGGLVAFGTLFVGWLNLRHNHETLRVQQQNTEITLRVQQENTQSTLEQQRRIEEQHAQDTALQAYLERIGELLLDKGLRTAEEAAEDDLVEDDLVREEAIALARMQTHTVLRRLDGNRKGSVLQFLYGLRLIGSPGNTSTIIDLSRADLSSVNLSNADLKIADLSGADLRHADLRHADLSGADLSGADLSNADLSGADLSGNELFGEAAASLWHTNLSNANLGNALLRGVELSDANLSDANLSNANLSKALLQGTNLGGADLSGADLSDARRYIHKQLRKAKLSRSTIMPDGSKPA
jgi:hypothetical protein